MELIGFEMNVRIMFEEWNGGIGMVDKALWAVLLLHFYQAQAERAEKKGIECAPRKTLLVIKLQVVGRWQIVALVLETFVHVLL